MTNTRDFEHKSVRARWTVVGGAALAAVVALVLWLSTPGFVRLTTYRLELLDARHSVLGAAPEGSPAPARVELEPGQDLTLLLRPATEHTEPIEVMTFLAVRGAADAQATAVVNGAQSAGSGAVRLTLGPADLPDWGRLIVMVGRRGAVPRTASTGSADHGHGWQRFDLSFSHR